jgi:hypothetical protein
MMNQILQGWKMVLKDYRHWKMILKYPYDAFDCAVFFGNLAQLSNSLDDWIKEMKQLDPDWEKNYYDNLWVLYDDIGERMNETDKLLEEVDEVLKK